MYAVDGNAKILIEPPLTVHNKVASYVAKCI